MGAGTVVTALLLRPISCISDKLDRRWLVIFGGSIAALLAFCLPLARSFGQLLVLSIGMGAFSVVSLPGQFSPSCSGRQFLRYGARYGHI
jgi:hypothetical protein